MIYYDLEDYLDNILILLEKFLIILTMLMILLIIIKIK